MLPVNLVLVRHGESEGNAAFRLSRENDLSAHTDQFRARHSSTWRLTPVGIAQSKRTGAWLRAQGFHLAPALVSPYARALETAQHLELPAATWDVALALRERSWGDLEPLPHAERQEVYAAALQSRETSPFFWTPPNGEPLVAVCERVGPVLRALDPECSADSASVRDPKLGSSLRMAAGAQNASATSTEPPTRPRQAPEGEPSALLVCHGEVMTAVRVLLDPAMAARVVDPTWLLDPWILVRNGDVVQYTRRDPAEGTLHPTWRWVRHVHAAEGPGATAPWESLAAQTLDSAALGRLAAAMHPLSQDGPAQDSPTTVDGAGAAETGAQRGGR